MIEYDEDWLLPNLFRWRGSVYYRAAHFAIPGTLLAIALMYVDDFGADYRSQYGLLEFNSSTLWSATTAVLLFAVNFRTKQGYSRFWEGTGLLHQMKGEWFDTVSNCVTFSIPAKRDHFEEVWQFRHTIVRLMSLCHASALEEISGLKTELETIDVRGIDEATLRHLKDCVEVHGFNKVEVILHLIQSLIMSAQERNLLMVPPPILSRVYQTCSRGYVNLLNSKKITDTKFPFPYVQLITFLLMLHTVLTPLMISSVLTNPYTAAVVTFMILFAAFSLNFIAIELENPFGDDDNDLPLVHFQTEMNSCLLMLLHYNTDTIPTASPLCIRDFHELKSTMVLSRGETVGTSEGVCVGKVGNLCGRTKKKPEPEEVPPTVLPGTTTGHRRSSKRLSDIGLEPADTEVAAATSTNISASCSQRSDQSVQSFGQSGYDGRRSPAYLSEQDAENRPRMHPCASVRSRAPGEFKGELEQSQAKSLDAHPAACVQNAACVQACTCSSKARMLSASPEVKSMRSQDAPVAPITESIQELNQSLQCWTKMMESQVKGLSRSFDDLNRMSSGTPGHNCIDTSWVDRTTTTTATGITTTSSLGPTVKVSA